MRTTKRNRESRQGARRRRQRRVTKADLFYPDTKGEELPDPDPHFTPARQRRRDAEYLAKRFRGDAPFQPASVQDLRS